jgi:hypothetical protein
MAVISAVLLVAAVAIATFGPESISLGQGLYLLDHDILDRLPAWATRLAGNWFWTSVVHWPGRVVIQPQNHPSVA